MMRRFYLFAGAAALLAISAAACAKKNFEDECDEEKGSQEGITVRGRLLVYDKFSWRCRSDGSYICPLPLTASEEGAEPYIHVYWRAGDQPGTIVPLEDGYNLIRDLRINAEDGRTARLGQRVEITGDLYTSFGCEIRRVHTLRLLDGPPLAPDREDSR